MHMRQKNDATVTDGHKSLIPKSEHKSFEIDVVDDLPDIKESEMVGANNLDDSASARPLQAARDFGNVFDDNKSSKTYNEPGKLGLLSMLDQSIYSDLSLDFLDDRLSVNRKSLLNGGTGTKRSVRQGL